MLLENVPLFWNFSRYLVTAAGYTGCHLHSLLVFLSQWGLPRAHVRWDGPPGPLRGWYLGFPLLLVLLQDSFASFPFLDSSAWLAEEFLWSELQVKQACGYQLGWSYQERQTYHSILFGKCGKKQCRTDPQRCAVLPAKTYKIGTGVKGGS